MHYQPNTQDSGTEQPEGKTTSSGRGHAHPLPMRTGRPRFRGKQIIPILIFGSIILVLIALIRLDPDHAGITREHLQTGLVIPLVRLLIYLGIGLFAGQAMESLGWAHKLALPARPIMRRFGLKDESSTAFVTAFASNLAANTLLAGYHKEGRITKREMTLTYLVNTGLPVFLVHLPTTFFIIAPLVKTAGLIYLGICLTAAGLKSLLVLVYCRITLGNNPSRPAEPPEDREATSTTPSRSRGFVTIFRKRFTRIVLYTIPIYIIVFLLNHLGFFEYLRTGLAHALSLSFFPVESASVVIVTLAAEFTSGAAAAGALLDGGVLSVKQTVLALIIGTIAATPIRALRHQLPSQAGIFSPSLALKQLCLSQLLRIGTIIVVALPYLAWF